MREQRFDRGERLAGILNAVVLVAAFIAFLARNLGNDAVWGDESDGIYRSLGYPNGYETLGLREVLEGTKATNDAGGFDVLLHWWMQVFGTGIVALRWLPAVFFLVYLAAVIGVGRRLLLPWWAATAVIGLMLIENITPYYALEIRPYAPELAASVAMLGLAWWLQARPSALRAAGFTAASIALLSHHYSGIAPAFGALVVLLAACRGRNGVARAWMLVPGVLAVAWLPMLYLALRGSPFAGERIRVWYLDAAMLRFADAGQWAHILSLNFLTPTGLPRTAFLLVVPVLALLAWRGRGRRPGAVIVSAWCYVAAVTAISAAMSVGGFLPWYLGTRWSINDVGLIAVSLAGLAALTVPWIRQGPRWLLVVTLVTAVAATAAGAARLAVYERGGPVGYLGTIGREMLAGGPSSLTVDAWLFRDVAYLIERSGDYDELRPGWDGNRASVVIDPVPTDADQVRTWLASERTRLLIRNVDPLEGVAVPASVEVIAVAGERGPILLVKRPG